MRFLYNRRLDVFADCNRAVGQYSLNDDNLQMRIAAASDLPCGAIADTRAFFQDLHHVTDVLLQGSDLYLTLETDSGTMHFTRQ